MPKPRKQPKTKSQETPKPELLEEPPRSEVSIVLAPQEPAAPASAPEPPPDTMVLGVDDERPGIDMISPPDGYVVPLPGVVDATAVVSRSAANIPLARVEWYLDGALVGTNRVLRDAATYEVSRSIRVPIGSHEIQAWLYNLTGAGQSDRTRGFKYVAPADKQPPLYTIFAPNRVGSADGKATIKISGSAQDASSDVCVSIESTAPKDGTTL